jgi:predicted metal-dependent hydrolase
MIINQNLEKDQRLDTMGIIARIKRSKRVRLMRISVSCDAGVVVTVPFGIEVGRLETFIRAKANWILRKVKYVSKFKNLPRLKASKAEYRELKLQALNLAQEKVKYWNQFYNFTYNRVSVKNQKTRWGSCSRKGNLNFNYKIVHLTSAQLDYLIVHELCHLKEMNHGRGFWELVGQTIPNYKTLRKELKNINLS